MRVPRTRFLIPGLLASLLFIGSAVSQEGGFFLDDFPDFGDTMFVSDIVILDEDEDVVEIVAMDCNGVIWIFVVTPEGELIAYELDEGQRAAGLDIRKKTTIGQFPEGFWNLGSACTENNAEVFGVIRSGDGTGLFKFGESNGFSQTLIQNNVVSANVDNHDDGTTGIITGDNEGGFSRHRCTAAGCETLFEKKAAGIGNNFHGFPFFLLSNYVFYEVNRGSDTQKKVACYSNKGQVIFDTVLTTDIHASAADVFLFSSSMLLVDQVLTVVFYNRFRRCIEAWFLNAQNGELIGKPQAISGDVANGQFSNISAAVVKGQRLQIEHFSGNEEISRFTLKTTSLTPNQIGDSDQAIRRQSSAETNLATVKSPVSASFLDQNQDRSLVVPTNSIGLIQTSINPTPQNVPQFADGGGIVDSIIINNLDPDNEVDVVLEFRDQSGSAMKLDRNGNQLTIPGSTFDGEISLTIPPHGRKSLTTDGQGPVVVGTVVVSSTGPVNVNSVFSGPIGLAGVAASPTFQNGFVAPIDSTSSENTGTGLAIQNRENREITVTLELYNSFGIKKATANIDIPANGQKALFVSQFDWDSSGINFNNFFGSIEATADGKTSAVAIQTRNGNQFATIPVKALNP